MNGILSGRVRNKKNDFKKESQFQSHWIYKLFYEILLDGESPLFICLSIVRHTMVIFLSFSSYLSHVIHIIYVRIFPFLSITCLVFFYDRWPTFFVLGLFLSLDLSHPLDISPTCVIPTISSPFIIWSSI